MNLKITNYKQFNLFLFDFFSPKDEKVLSSIIDAHLDSYKTWLLRFETSYRSFSICTTKTLQHKPTIYESFRSPSPQLKKYCPTRQLINNATGFSENISDLSVAKHCESFQIKQLTNVTVCSVFGTW